MTPQNRKFFCIVVHYGAATTTDEAIASLVAGTRVPDEIVVVDNAKDVYKNTQPGVRVIRPEKNSGYGGGLNIGLGSLYVRGLAPTDIVIGMNNDMRVMPDTIANLEAWLANNPEPALIGAVITEGDDTVHGVSMVNLITGRALPYHRFRGWGLPFIHGAFIAAPFEVLVGTHGFPDQYFMYWEDVLLSQRARAAGYPLKVAKNVRVAHATRSGPTTADQTYYQVRNGAAFLERETGHLIKPLWWFANRARYLYHRQRKSQGSAVTVSTALRDAFKQVNGQRADE